jgi:hypothetical protein
MIKHAFKNGLQDLWEEAFYLILFNLICVASTIFCPLTLFGLFATVHDVGQEKGIKIMTLFNHISKTWQQAIIWGAINYALIIVAWFNLSFYSQFNTTWAMVIQFMVIGLMFSWWVLQLIMLAIYPHLPQPTFKLALQNAATIIGLYPLNTLILIFIVLCLLIISAIMPIIFIVVVIAFIATLTNRLVAAILKRELKKQEVNL